MIVSALAFALTTGSAQFGKPKVNEQIRIGQKVADQLRKTEKVLPVDDPRSRLLRKIASKILITIHDKEAWAFSFEVIDSPEINAFSLPGGPTFFYTGLLDKLKTEDEVAGVLSHELTHVRLQHWATQYAASQRRDLLINLGLILAKANFPVSEVAGLTDQLIFSLPFSRNEERQADEGGFTLMTQAGYNPEGMVHVFEMFSKTIRGDGGPNFLSDHPSDQSRIKRIQDLIDAAHQPAPPETILDY